MSKLKEMPATERKKPKQQGIPNSARKINPAPVLQGALAAVVAIALVALFSGTGLLGTPTAGIVLPSLPVSEDSAAVADKTVDYINTYFLGPQGLSAELVSVEEQSPHLFAVSFNVMEDGSAIQEATVYVTKDGREMLLGNIFDLDEVLEIPEVPADDGSVEGEINSCEDAEKTDKPALDVFVVSRCPYGIQSMNGLVSVAELLKDRADITVRYISTVGSDGTVSAMHGEAELEENRRQICLREEQPEKFWSYIKCYAETGEPAECEVIAGVDSAALSACVAESSTRYLIADATLGGVDRSRLASPSFFLNGKKINEMSPNIFDRSPEGLKNRVCCGMVTPADECSEELLTTTPPAGFGEIGDTAASGSGSC